MPCCFKSSLERSVLEIPKTTSDISALSLSSGSTTSPSGETIILHRCSSAQSTIEYEMGRIRLGGAWNSDMNATIWCPLTSFLPAYIRTGLRGLASLLRETLGEWTVYH